MFIKRFALLFWDTRKNDQDNVLTNIIIALAFVL